MSNTTPQHVRPPTSASQLHFLTRIERKDGHWFYTSSNSIRWGGAGRISPARAVWAAYKNYVPTGARIYATCGVAGCVNPEHLEMDGEYPSRVCSGCGGKKLPLSKLCAFCAGKRKRKEPAPPEEPAPPQRQRKFPDEFYLTECPGCGGKKSQGAALCRACRHPEPKHPSTGTTCPACGGLKNLQSRTCRACYSKAVKDGLVHGTEAGYNRGCRCPGCREAARVGRSLRRRKAIAVGSG